MKGFQTFRYRTADISAATDIAQIKSARDSGDPVRIERCDGRVSAGVAKLQRLGHSAATAVKRNEPPISSPIAYGASLRD